MHVKNRYSLVSFLQPPCFLTPFLFPLRLAFPNSRGGLIYLGICHLALLKSRGNFN